ncbi:MAG: undecaprenyl-diphosphate phosphatase [Deferribacteraceae bacterium]|nr:undecaprenyl-diphosphate phosphatase [Deferribacteraceae bacterium]
MNILQALLLGVVQGVTEFLPISSSGHLALLQSTFDNFEQPGLLFDTLLHLATLFALLLYFRKRVLKLLKAFLGFFFSSLKIHYYEERDLLWGIVIATIPTAIMGLSLQKVAISLFEKPAVVGYMLILTSILLYLSGKQNYNERVSPVRALIVGFVQGFAVLPGLSRSGSTIFTALATGISRERAAEFSFLISMPAVAGACILEARHLGELTAGNIPVYAVAMAAAFLTGFASIGVMMNLVRRAKLDFFAVYCLILGVFAILWV